MNNLEVLSKLAIEAIAADKRKDVTLELARLSNVSLTKEFEDLAIDYDNLHQDCEIAEARASAKTNLNTRLLSASNAVESLTDDLCAANITIGKLSNDRLSMSSLQRKITEQSVEIKSLSTYKRKVDVLTKDLKDCEAKLLKARSIPASKPVKQPKVTKNYKDLQAENARLNDYIKQLVEYGNTAPQFAGGLKHSKQGVMDFIDSKAEMMGVTDPKTGDSREVMVQRMFVINQHNSVKTLTRIVGEDGVHTVKVPKGGTVTIDDEVKDHVTEYFNKLDDMNGKIKQQKAGKR